MTEITLIRDHPAEGWLSMDRYAGELFTALNNLSPAGISLNLATPPDPWPSPYGRLLSRATTYVRWAKQQPGTLFHVLDHSYAIILAGLPRARSIITVHDIAPLYFPGRKLGLSSLSWRFFWRFARQAQHIIVDSQFIADQIRPHLSPSAKIYVIHLAVSPDFAPDNQRRIEMRRRYNLEDHFVLIHVGGTQPRKNVGTAVETAHRLREAGYPVKFLKVGGSPDFITQQKEKYDTAGLIEFIPRATEAELVGLYNAADALLFPSLYEGFGFPVIEAMASGTPVIAGRATSLPEVAGEAAILCHPERVDEFVKATSRLIDDPGYRDSLRQAGLERARLFSWARTAAKTLSVYEEVLSGQKE